MNLFQLVLKQMRQRALSTTLTFLSVALGVGLAIAIMVFQREGNRIFAQSDFGYDLIVGPKGSKLQLVLNTTYHLGAASATMPWSVYERLPREYSGVKWAVPYAVGDNYRGHPIVATLPKTFGVAESGAKLPPDQVFEYRKGRRFELAAGRVFHARKFEAVIGSEVAQRTGLKVGDKYKAEHGTESSAHADEHGEQWTVVGILQPTQTANDRVIFIPLVSFFAVPAHEKGLEEITRFQETGRIGPATRPATAPATQEAHDVHEAGHEHEEAYELLPDGTIELKARPEEWRISAILLCSTSPIEGDRLYWAINNGVEATAAIPAREMHDFFDTFFKTGALLLLVISLLVTVVAAVSILVSIYNSISARRQEIAILRALGATRRRVLALVCLEAGLIGLVGGIAGLVLGHIAAGVAVIWFRSAFGEGMRWLVIGPGEVLYLLVVTLLAVLAGLAPALKAYRTPVATHLTGG